MKRLVSVLGVAALAALPLAALAAPVPGIYTSIDIPGGQMLTGRASTWRPGINSGLPHVLHAQSWNGTTLGTEWEIRCAVENAPFLVQDNRVGGVGTVVYTSTFNGGSFTFFPTGGVWGDGTGTLSTTTLITTVQFLMIGGISTPVASVVNGNTSGFFVGGCYLTFAIGNGRGVGETTSLDLSITKPAGYPDFLDAGCGLAPANQQFGTWGDVFTLTVGFACPVPAATSTWSQVKALYN